MFSVSGTALALVTGMSSLSRAESRWRAGRRRAALVLEGVVRRLLAVIVLALATYGASALGAHVAAQVQAASVDRAPSSRARTALPPGTEPPVAPGPNEAIVPAPERSVLAMPVLGADAADLRDDFSDARGGSRTHHAIDILAPRHTPVVAADDGTIVKLFVSARGGLTIYQFDPTTTYCYYYAHLEGYARGLEESQPVRRGDVIGFVGTSGNAPKDTPHLHFSVNRLGPEKRWWETTPMNPYSLLRPPG